MATKSLKFLALTATAVLALACAKEPVAGGEGETGVSFSVEVPGIQETKAIGDGTAAKTLYYQAFDENGAAIEGLGVQNKPISGTSTTVEFQLIKDQTYSFVFWAQTDADGYYTLDPADGLKKISANYAGKSANDENFDAFYAVKKLTVTGPVSETVALTRPFAQINIATAGTISAGSASREIDFTGATSSVTVKKIPTVFTPLEDKVSMTKDVTFGAAEIPAGNITVNGTDYKYLSMNYVFAPAAGTVYDVNAIVTVDGKNVNISVPSAPAKRNWKTNIVGNILTADAGFTVVVTPEFEGSSKFDPDNITTKAELSNVLVSYKTATVKNEIPFDSFLSSKDNYTLNIESTGAIIPAADMKPELSEVLFVGGKTLTLDGKGKIVGPSNSTYGNGSQAILVQGGNVEIKGDLNIDGGSGSVANRAMKITNGTATIYGGHFHSGLDKNGKSSEVIFLNPAYRKTAKLYIYGGTFETEGDASYLINMYDNSRSSCEVKIYGGTFVGFDPANVNEGDITSFVADGYTSLQIGTNPKTFTVVATSELAANCEALRDKIAEGGTIEVTDNILLTGYPYSVPAGKNTHINIAKNASIKALDGSFNTYKVFSFYNDGGTLSGEGSIIADNKSGRNNICAIEVMEGNTLVIEGNLKINGGSNAEGNNSAVRIDDGTVIIKGGYFSVGLDKNGRDNSCVLLYASGAKAELIVEDGVFEAEGNGSSVINCQDENKAKCNVQLKGGIYVNFNPADNSADGEHTNYVAAGYKSVETTYHGKQAWEVVKE